MKTLHNPRFLLTIIPLLACLTTSVLAQSDLPPLPPGASYSLGGTMTPGGGGGFQPDDYGPPGGFGGNGGSGGQGGCLDCTLPNYGYGFYLSIALGPESNTCLITLHNTTNGLPYLIESALSLSGPWYTNQSLLATNVSPNTNMVAQPIAIESYQGVFFRGLQAAPGELRWAVQLVDIATDTNADAFGNGLDASPSLSPDGQTVYMTTASHTVWAIDAISGMPVWTNTIFTNDSTPQIAEFTGSALATSSNIYAGSTDGYLYCLSATNGSILWRKSMGSNTAVYGTPSLDTSGRILVPSDETEASRDGNPIAGLTCLVPTATNASVAWFFQPQDLHNLPGSGNINNAGDIDSSVTVANNGTIYFLAEGWRLYSLDPTSKVNWYIPVQADGEPDSSVAIDSFGRVLVGCNSEYMYCVNPDGSLEWTFPVGLLPYGDYGPMQCSPTIGTNDALYTGTGGGSGALISLDSSGDANWLVTPSSGNATISSPAVGVSNLYFGSTSGEFFSVTLSDQVIAWSVTNSHSIFSSPLICPDGSVIYGCEDGFLYCFWGSSLPAGTNASWPTFHGNNQRTGLQPGTNTMATNNGAPFVSNGTNDGAGHFTFDIVGTTNGSWTVYTSTNLSNWSVFLTNVTLSGSPATNIITDNTVGTMSNRFYQLSNSNGVSRAIGFTRLTITPGTNLVADQLCQVDDGVLRASPPTALGFAMNDLSALFFLAPWATNTDGSAIFAWNGNGFDGDTNLNGAGPPDWIGGGNMTMLPGTSVIVSNGLGVSYPIWFTGLVRNQQIFSLQAGTNYLSASAPIAGNITNITGYRPNNGDTVKLWNTSTSNYVSHPYASNSWGTNGVPFLNIGQGFVLISTNAYTWTNNWLTMAP